MAALLTDDADLARRAHSLIDCGRAKDPDEKEFTFGANYRLGELHAACSCRPWSGSPASRPSGPKAAGWFQELAAGLEGVRLLPPDPHHPLELLPLYRADRAGGLRRGHQPAGLRGAGGRGVGAWEGYEPMSRYDLFQPGLSRLPVAVEHAARLDPARMSFPVAEDAGLRRTVYLDENVFGPGGAGSRTRSRPWPRSSATPASWPARTHWIHRGATASLLEPPGPSRGRSAVGPAGLQQRLLQGAATR